ncbi:FAD synthase [Patescibacteria group bacterium]|nr:FAD synthase [Patescibacteria group bacterium]MBU1074560.1 FAD synthase [Patescibacteria group bacterium]MBU1951454.1 FAD synthase [Patescibacteria group bacterium]MBU2229343.1 FAD synthase [Patescibacteria group bacterium]
MNNHLREAMRRSKPDTKRKKVLVFGAFDILHPGHLNFFEQAKQYGDFLIVVIGRDKNIEKIKGQKPINDENKRLETVKSNSIIDQTVLGYEDDKYRIIKELAPDIICLGYDQKAYTEKLENKLADFGLVTKVVRLKPFHPEKYKSSKLKESE